MGSGTSKLRSFFKVFNHKRRRPIASDWQRPVEESFQSLGQRIEPSPTQAVLRDVSSEDLPQENTSESPTRAVPHEVSNENPQEENTSSKVTIQILPADVLLQIFDSYRLDSPIHSQHGERPWEWLKLAYVCKTWRSVLLASPHYLGIRLFFTNGVPAREILSFWPDLPIVMQYMEASGSSPLTLDDQDNVMALLEHPTRLREIQLTVTTPLLERVTTLTQQPFSQLDSLLISTMHGLVLPSEFGGGMHHLRALRTVGLALPALPQILLSTRDLVSLQLEEIPSVGYTLEALIVCLPTMTQLKTLRIHFLSPTSRPVLISTARHLPGFSILPVLHSIECHGTSEYLESLLSGISAPRLKNFYIDFFNQPSFDIPQLSRFISHSGMQQSLTHATIRSSFAGISITLTQREAEVCDRLSTTLADVEQLEISAFTSVPGGKDDVDLIHFDLLELFRPFRNMKSLRVTKASLSLVAGALGLVSGELAVVALPELQEIWTENREAIASVEKSLAPFISACDRSHRPVVVRSNKRRALLVGISYTGPHNQWSALDGPHDDVNRFQQLLTDTYGYRPEDITMMRDDLSLPELSHPTRVNMIRELKRLVSDAAPGDTFVFLYSGHSDQQLAIDDIHEEDNQDERAQRYPFPLPIGCSLIAILDTCHSGTLLDLPHYHCNTVYVPWQSKGTRRTLTMQNNNVRRQATYFTDSASPGQPLPTIAGIMDLQEPGDRSARPTIRVDDGATKERSLFLSQPRSASPESLFACNGWCDRDDNPYPNVVSLSACSDLQRAWEGPNGSLTTVVCNYLSSDSHAPVIPALLSHINFQLHDNALELHKYTRYQKVKASHGEGEGFDGELDNFQEPVLSSLAKLNMDEILKL
ncbi:caspase domain-containing protein [Lactarius quietus]|nr:caspase domain-containing protein [Lactarius quietus]